MVEISLGVGKFHPQKDPADFGVIKDKSVERQLRPSLGFLAVSPVLDSGEANQRDRLQVSRADVGLLELLEGVEKQIQCLDHQANDKRRALV